MEEANQEIPSELQEIADKTFARPQRSYLEKLYGGKFEYKGGTSTHIKFN
jgi:hypothetical protein